MKKRFLIIGIVLLGIGLLNLFWYAPHSITLLNQPFPFAYLQEVEIRDGGISVQTWYEPFEVIKHHPYWLAWSLALYLGIIFLSAHVFQTLRKSMS